MGYVQYTGAQNPHSQEVDIAGYQQFIVNATPGMTLVLPDPVCSYLVGVQPNWWSPVNGWTPPAAGPQTGYVAWVFSTYTATSQNGVVLADPTSGGSFPVTLPDATTVGGQKITINHPGSANTVTVTPAGGQTIAGLSSFALNAGEDVTVYSDGTSKWRLLSQVAALSLPVIAERTTNKDQPSGYAGLDSSALLKLSEMPPSVVSASSAMAASVPLFAVADPSGVYGYAFGAGNGGGMGTGTTGSPAGSMVGLAVYQKYGTNDGNNTAVTKTTVGAAVTAIYYGPTTDDVMEGLYAFAAAKNTGVGFTQTKNITAFEGHAQTEGANHVSGTYVAATAGRVTAAGTSVIDTAHSVYAYVQKDAGATITTYNAFFQAVAGVGVTNWGVNVIDPVLTQGFVKCSDLELTSARAAVPDDLAKAMGLQAWNVFPGLLATAQAPTAGTVYATALPLQKGAVVTNIIFDVETAGSGTAPTHIYAGICDSSGNMVAQSNDLAASSQWTAQRFAQAALSATYTVPTSGLYYAVFLQVGAWGTTQLALGRGSEPKAMPNSTFWALTGTTTGQTALPANASPIAGGLTHASQFFFFAGAN